MNVTPADVVSLESAIAPPSKSARLSLHLVDQSGVDRGALRKCQWAAETIAEMKWHAEMLESADLEIRRMKCTNLTRIGEDTNSLSFSRL
jgi:hypothetical protein